MVMKVIERSRALYLRFRSVVAAGLLTIALPSCSSSNAQELLLIENGVLMTMAPGQEEPFVGYVAVGEDGRITAIGEGPAPSGLAARSRYDAAGKFVTPGFISAHSHVWQSAFRGLAADQLVREGWSEAVYRQMAIQSPAEDFYWYTLHGLLDHGIHGITSVYNFTYGNRGAGEFAAEQWRGAIDSGVRFIHSYARSRDVSAEKQREELATFIDYARPRMDEPTFLKMSVAGTAGSLEAVALDKELMERFDMSNQTHYLEYPREKEQQQATFTNIEAAGMLGPDLSFGHFIHTTEPMLKAAAAAGAGMSWNPLSNGRLASGIADIPKYLTLGVKVGMGVDGQASADLPDPFENMRMGLYMIRAKYESALVMQPVDVMRLHTLGSAEVLGIADKVGSLEVGKFGDILLIDPKAVDRAPVFDAYATLVFATNVLNLERVYVGGELTVLNRKPVRQDSSKISDEVWKRVTSLKPPPGFETPTLSAVSP
jgi:cytosine/adenosine deaminase-related metal-dependent hydrolase